MPLELSIIINTRNRKEMLYALLNSITLQDIKESYEVVIVDDCSDEDYSAELLEKYPFVIFFRNQKREFLISSRNKGWKLSNGKYALFIDDDNEFKSRNTIQMSLDIIRNHPDIGILGFRTYYFDDPDTVLIGPNSLNKFIGRVKFNLMNTSDKPEYEGLVDTYDNPNAFLTTKEVLEKTGGFNPIFVQTFSEADFAERVRKLKLKVVQSSDLKAYHKSPKIDYSNLSLRLLGGSPERFYYLMRNRFLLIRSYGSLLQIIVFTLFFSMLYNLYYLGITLKFKEYKMFRFGLQGILAGYYIIFFGTPPPRPF